MNNNIAYYCFNKHCCVSIYHHQTAICTVMPLDHTFTGEIPLCIMCCTPMVSKVDLDVKSLIINNQIMPVAR